MTAIILTAESMGQFIAVFLIFIFVLAVTFFTTRFIGNYQKEKLNGSNIKVVETQNIALNKYIQLVKIGDRYFALAVSKDSVTTIAEIPAESLSFTDNGNTSKFSFKEFLAKAKEESSDETKIDTKEIDKD